MWIKDLTNGSVREYGINHHDSLVISDDGKSLYYSHLQNGDGSQYGNYRFVVDEEGHIPEEDEVLMRHGAEAYFNIGGFTKIPRSADIAFIAENYGSKQITVAIEEMSELIKELCKSQRQTTDDIMEVLKIESRITEEMADVMVMMYQLMCIFGNRDGVINIFNKKIDRQLERIKKENAEKLTSEPEKD